ncbi:MAG: anti-sigma factor [Blastocatellia bacterium]
MSCQETQNLMHGYLDGELDLVRSLEFERHLQACQTCSHKLQNQQALRSAITSAALYQHAPAHLHRRVQSAIRAASEPEAVPWMKSWIFSWRWLSAGASLAALAILIFMLVPVLMRPSANEMMAQEVISAHVRSLMASHLTDVASTDQHTVKPWFNGRLDFSPPVKDLAESGFPLVGGRLDYLNNRPVAALVYQRRKHYINLFIWPSAQDAAKAKPEQVSRQGWHLMRWTSAGMTYWAVSDLNEGELQEFVQLLRNQAAPTITPQ